MKPIVEDIKSLSKFTILSRVGDHYNATICERGGYTGQWTKGRNQKVRPEEYQNEDGTGLYIPAAFIPDHKGKKYSSIPEIMENMKIDATGNSRDYLAVRKVQSPKTFSGSYDITATREGYRAEAETIEGGTYYVLEEMYF